ncbi:YhcN/YlaJ family sporulation lipoprotein [Virgibacillus sp. 179-BFC.A HS]|uniref:YhcN/YlaJ family sporulation lipoprotein n=1 Tax=Tigheibacillus jepli TaxID=3035914 RepID=A0ABU5CJM5_9BACI|nr:YhcN/YlaJ family sporulation lipoprotein [Virgibacillus sp. 179-BFC.A HS]MDY0406004.1 YhcN/YlaJ family sporulation lipoprotein [Virgibacillus sp. 179-BFC.A HS]
MYKFVTALMIGIAVLAGCQNNNDDNALPDEKSNNRIAHVENSSQLDRKDLTNNQIASHLSGVAERIPNVKNAAAVVAGPYAVVGIDVDKDLDRSRVGTVKYSVTEAMRHDPYGKTAVVVADADVTQRLRNMRDKISQGYPVQGVVDELATIVGRYMPEFPVPDNTPEEKDQNKKTIPKDHQDKLDRIQDKQSNHQK